MIVVEVETMQIDESDPSGAPGVGHGDEFLGPPGRTLASLKRFGSHNGWDLTHRFPEVAAAVAALRAHT